MATDTKLAIPVIAGIFTAAGAVFLVHRFTSSNPEQSTPASNPPAPPVVIIREAPPPAQTPRPTAPVAPARPSLWSELLQGAPAIIDAAGRYKRGPARRGGRYEEVTRYRYPDPVPSENAPIDTSWIDDYWRGYLLALKDRDAANQMFRDNPTNVDLLNGLLDGAARIPPRDPKGVQPRPEQLPAGVAVPALPGFGEGQMISKEGSADVFVVTGRSKHQLAPGAVARRGGMGQVIGGVPAPVFNWYVDDNKVEN